MNWLPDDIKEASGGETIDHVARDSIRLAHKALDRFPDLVRRHKVIAGGAAISSSLVIIAGVAIARRMRKGESAEEAVASITEQEIDRPERVTRPRPSSHAETIAEAEAAAAAAEAAADAASNILPINGVTPAGEIPPARVD